MIILKLNMYDIIKNIFFSCKNILYILLFYTKNIGKLNYV